MADAVRGDVTQPAAADPDQTVDGAEPRAEEPAAAKPTEPNADYVELLSVERRHYAIVGELAKGGMGRILEARDLRLGRQVAIKELLPKHRDAARRFEREARITARLQHPAIIHVYEAGVWPGGEPFYAMPKVQGRSLDKVVAERKTLVERLALVPNVIAVADALAYAHSESVIHRDLKPANVLVGEFGQTVVIDWGLAKDLGGPLIESKDSAFLKMRSPAEETQDGGVVGTPAYMPPEQARGEAVDQRADVYAIGALLYKVLVGHAPYSGPSSKDVIEAVKTAPPVPLDVREPGAPPELVAIVAKAMAREPSERYSTAGELAKDLERFQTGQLVAAHRYTPAQLVVRFVRRYRLALSIAVAAIAALAILAAISVRRVLDEKTRTEAQRLALLEERGRTELLADRAGPALAYLVEAARGGADDRALAFLLEEAARPFEASRELAVGGGPVAIAVSSDGKHIAAGSDRFAFGPIDGKLAVGPVLKGRIGAVAFDPTGMRIAYAGDNGTATIVPLDGSKQVELRGHDGSINDIAFSADGKLVVTASDDKTARVWNAASGNPVAKSKCYESAVLSARFSPDATRIATAGEDGNACVWSVEGNSHVWDLRGHTAAVRSVRWNRDGTMVVTASDDGSAFLLNPDNGKPLVRALKHPSGKGIVAAEFSPDGERVLTASRDHTAIVWELPAGSEDGNVASARPIANLVGHTDELVAATFDQAGEHVATAGLDGVAKVWDAATGMQTHSFEHAFGVASIAFAGKDRLVTGDLEGGVHVWEIAGGIVRERHATESAIHAIAAAGDLVAAGTEDSRVTLGRGTKDDVLTAHMGRVFAVALSSDGNTMVSAGEDPRGIVWDVVTNQPKPTARVRCQLGAHDDDVVTLSAAIARARVAIVVPDAIELWSTADCKLAFRAETPAEGLAAVSIRGDGSLIAAGGQHVIVWAPGDAPHPLPLTKPAATALAFSPDGMRLLVGGKGWASVIGLPDGRERTVLDGPFGEVTAVGWLDEERVVTANAEGVAKIWNVDSGKLLALRGTPGAPATSIAATGNLLWVGRDDGIVRAWDVRLVDPKLDLDALVRLAKWHIGSDGVARRGGEHEDAKR